MTETAIPNPGSLGSTKALIEVYRGAEDWHPYPWRFAVTYGGERHEFAGLPNQCATKRQASIRARWRAKWLEDGSFAQRYGTPIAVAS